MQKLSLLLLVALSCSAPKVKHDGFVPLCNGRNLDGWVNVNCAPETWSVRDGVIHCTGRPTGALRTARQYENFILELEWRHLASGGNSGVFIWGTPVAAPGVPFLRGIETQVLDHGYNPPGKGDRYTTHGDVFPIHGATMQPFGRHNGQRSFPSGDFSQGSPEWNHYRIVGSNGVLRLSVNGHEVSGGAECHYRQGYLALESEGAPVEFRNLRIKELPPSGAAAEVTAPLDQGWHSLFTGLDLRGWKTNAATTARWQVSDERLLLRSGAAEPETILWSARSFGDAEFIVDGRPAKVEQGKEVGPPTLQFRGAELKLAAEPGQYQRFLITVQGRAVTVRRNGQEIQRLTLPADAPLRSALGLRPASGAVEFMNLYAREL